MACRSASIKCVCVYVCGHHCNCAVETQFPFKLRNLRVIAHWQHASHIWPRLSQLATSCRQTVLWLLTDTSHEQFCSQRKRGKTESRGGRVHCGFWFLCDTHIPGLWFKSTTLIWPHSNIPGVLAEGSENTKSHLWDNNWYVLEIEALIFSLQIFASLNLTPLEHHHYSAVKKKRKMTKRKREGSVCHPFFFFSILIVPGHYSIWPKKE